ncbi:MAG: nucleoside/nucleotide kinase family protein [Corynebacteriales bacterium]|nr:nucleoside/nucleotide kinase family protein [Mycobacteriales bacterium]
MQPVAEVSQVERATATSDLAALVDELAARARSLVASGERRILGITGPPGVGKSTLCAMLAARLGSDAVLVGMDAFHLANEELERLHRRDRKGAPDTFDVDGYVALLRRLRSQSADLVYAPRFERAIEESIGSAVPIARTTPLVVTEGNYLLLDRGGWEEVRGVLDEVWFLDAAADVRAARLVRRHEHHGRSHDDALRWTEDVDMRNAAVITATRHRADLAVTVPDAQGSAPGAVLDVPPG